MDNNLPLTDAELQDYFLVVARRKKLDKESEKLKKIEEQYKKKFTWDWFESERGSLQVQNRPEFELLDQTLIDTVREEHPDLYESCLDIKLFCKTVKDIYPDKVKTIPKYTYTAKPDPSIWSLETDD